MMISNLIVVALGLATPALPATVAEPQPAAAQADGPAADAKKVCRRITATGTRLPKRVCRTKAEWDRDAAQVKQDIRTGPGNAGRDPFMADKPF